VFVSHPPTQVFLNDASAVRQNLHSSTSQVPFPIPYQGSKRKLAGVIIGAFPADVENLYEPFCGSAAVALAALARGAVQSVSLNDSNGPLIALWKEILERPSNLASNYRRLWLEQTGREQDFYNEIRDRFNQVHDPELLLYLLARCVKAAVRYNSSGEFNQSPDNRRRGSHPDRMENHLQRASALLQDRCDLTAGNYEQAIQRAGPTDLVYMDPPYQGVSTNRDRRYRDVLAFDEFVDVLQALNQRHVSFIVSYDGQTGSKVHGKPLPTSLMLDHIEIDCGRSTQATLLGHDHRTVESLYLSPALVERLEREGHYRDIDGPLPTLFSA